MGSGRIGGGRCFHGVLDSALVSAQQKAFEGFDKFMVAGQALPVSLIIEKLCFPFGIGRLAFQRQCQIGRVSLRLVGLKCLFTIWGTLSCRLTEYKGLNLPSIA
jgi:hypothetical protein